MWTCLLDPVVGVCSLDIKWDILNSKTSTQNVQIQGLTFASAPSGNKTAPWIGGRGRFDLYDGKTLLGSVRVGVK